MMLRSQIIGCGSYLPANVVSNDELSRRVDTSDAWIRERSGIETRHIAAEDEFTSHLGIAAGQAALDNAEIEAGELDLIVLATSTPDETFPSTASRIQTGLGALGSAAFDVQAVCTGFVYALAVADNFIRCGQARTIMVIGAETFSRILDWNDRATCVLFGDGAGALVLRAEEGNGKISDRGVLSTHLHCDGRDHDCLYVDGGPSSTGTVGVVKMQGKEIFKKAVVRLTAVAEEALSAHGLEGGDIDWLIPHQANLRIIKEMAKKLGFEEEKVIVTIDRHANTSAASIPLALDWGRREGKIQPGHLLLLEAIGGGLTWGAAIVRW
jgi:3-oxoacyl-[acyl-carrier-protein] synthase-3